MDASFAVFAPKDGAILDQVSLQAIADVPNLLLGALMDGFVPTEDNIILHGLDRLDVYSKGPPLSELSLCVVSLHCGGTQFVFELISSDTLLLGDSRCLLEPCLRVGVLTV